MEKIEKALLSSVIKKANDGTYEFIMSDETIDRDGEIIRVEGWDLKNFKKNSPLLWGHRHDIPAIGVVGMYAKENGQLVAKKVRFATEGIYDLADQVHGLVDDKVLKAVSVGYIPKKRTYPKQDEDDEEGKGVKGKKKPRVITEEAELYELSIVNVGSNPNALAVLKSAEEKAAKDYENARPAPIPDEKQQSNIESLMDRLVEKIDRLCETIEKMAKPKDRRIYDAIFAGDLDEVQPKPADKEEKPNPFNEGESPKPLFKE